MIGIIADVHGNYPALKSVLHELNNLSCNKIISVGDVVGYYCMPNECIDLFREMNIEHIMGNHDNYMIKNLSCSRSNTVNLCLNYQRKIIRNDNFEWLMKAAYSIDDQIMSVRHGGWNNCLEEYIDIFDFEQVKNRGQKFYISAHTHIPKIQYDSEKIYFNPGSVGQPRDGNSKAAYATIDDNGLVRLYRVDYDIDEIVYYMRKAGFAEKIYKGLYEGQRIGLSEL